MNDRGAYEYSKPLLDRDYEKFEMIVDRLIGLYGADYDNFLKIIEKEIRRFYRKKDYLHNTFADSLLIYLFARCTLDNLDKEKIHFVEFSPMWGWSTFILLRAIKDSGKGEKVELFSCEYNAIENAFEMAMKNLRFVKNHISFNSLKLIYKDALIALKEDHKESSIDFLLIDSDHSREFAKKYLYDSRVFSKCTQKAIIHIYDFKFWLEGTKEKWKEPIVLAEYFKDNPDFVSSRILGHVFMLLGGSHDYQEMVDARRAQRELKYFTSESNYFVRKGLPEQYWLGGAIDGVNHPTAGSKGKGVTYLLGLAIWLIPKEAIKPLRVNL